MVQHPPPSKKKKKDFGYGTKNHINRVLLYILAQVLNISGLDIVIVKST